MPAWLQPLLLLAWAALSFLLPQLAPQWLSPTLAYGLTALGGPLGFLVIVAVFARAANRR